MSKEDGLELLQSSIILMVVFMLVNYTVLKVNFLSSILSLTNSVECKYVKCNNSKLWETLPGFLLSAFLYLSNFLYIQLPDKK